MTRDDPRCRPDPRALSRLCAERRELLSCAAKGLQLELLNRQAAVLLSHRQPGVGIRSRKSVVVVLLIVKLLLLVLNQTLIELVLTLVFQL